jgi:hypothetical protein
MRASHAGGACDRAGRGRTPEALWRIATEDIATVAAEAYEMIEDPPRGVDKN